MLVCSQGRDGGRKQHTHPPSLNFFLLMEYMGRQNVIEQYTHRLSYKAYWVPMHFEYSALCCRSHIVLYGNTVSTFKKEGGGTVDNELSLFVDMPLGCYLIANAHLSRLVDPPKEGGVLPPLSWPNFL